MMKRILCTLENASENNNGIPFEKHERGMISVGEVPAEMAEIFLSVDGFEEVEDLKPLTTAQQNALEKAEAEAKAQAEAEAKAKADAEAASGGSDGQESGGTGADAAAPAAKPKKAPKSASPAADGAEGGDAK